MKDGLHLLSKVLALMFLIGRSVSAFVSRPARAGIQVGLLVGNERSPTSRLQSRLQSTATSNNPTNSVEKQGIKQQKTKIKIQKKSQAQHHQPPLINLFTISKEDLEEVVVMWGYPKYRAGQVYHWIREKGVVDVEKMQNIPKDLRRDLAKFSSSEGEQTAWIPQAKDEKCANRRTASGGALEVVREQVSSKDGTIKRLYRLRDGLLIESVLMPYEDGRWTSCISSQAGCAMQCAFCATGQNGFQRQLTSDEIVEQVTRFSTLLKSKTQPITGKPHGNAKKKRHNKQQRLSNVVFMGEGEPLANFKNVMEAVPRIQELAGIGARKITISTVGVVPNIKKLMVSPIQVRLAVSLHCASEDERSALLPANRRYGGLDVLMTTLHEYIETTGRRITLEWALIQGENDTPEVGRQLGNLLKKYRLRRDMCHVNVIPLNPTGGYSGSASGKRRVNEFIRVLEEEFGVSCTPRVRRGIDIDAGCGQLKSKELDKEEDDEEELKLFAPERSVLSQQKLFSCDAETIDLDSDVVSVNEDDGIMDDTFDAQEAARLIAMVQGTTIKDA